MPATLVIGYGNPLRSDDGVGWRVADAVAAWRWPHVRAIAVHQLIPELADSLAEVDCVIFVDAGVTGEENAVQFAPLAPVSAPSALGHTSDQGSLLALTLALHGRCPEAWLITVAAVAFDFGAGLSPTAERGVTAALQHIRILVGNRNTGSPRARLVGFPK